MKNNINAKLELAAPSQSITLLADSKLQVSDAELKDAVDYAKIAGKQSIQRQLDAAESKLKESRGEVSAHNKEFTNTVVPLLRIQARSHPRIQALSKALRGLCLSSSTPSVLTQDVYIGDRWGGYTSAKDLERWCDGKKVHAKLTLPIRVEPQENARDSDGECSMDLTLKLPEDALAVYELLHCALLKRAEDEKVVEGLKKKLEDLPNAVRAVRAAVLEQRLNRTESGRLALAGVQTHISAFLDGRYENLLPG